MQHSASDRGVLLHASGELVGACIGELRDIEPLDHFVHTVSESGAGNAVHFTEKLQDLARREARVQAGLAREKTDLFANLRRVSHDVVSREYSRACTRF